MWRVKANALGTSDQGTSKQGFSEYSPRLAFEEVIGTIGKRIAFLSFPPLFAERCLLQAGEDGSWPRGSVIALGEGEGLILSQERTLPDSFPGGLLLSLEERKNGEGRRQSFYFLIFYIPRRKFQKL